METGPPFEYGSSASSEELWGFKVLFNDNTDGEGATIPPRSVLRMSVKKEEVSFCTVNFLSKANHHDKFDSWGRHYVCLPRDEEETQRLRDHQSPNLGEENGS